MIIDQFYTKNDKSNFYLGMVSSVFREKSYIQVENLSLLNHRRLKLEYLIPNTINYFVVIDSVQGLFIGEIFQSKVNSSDSVHDSMNRGFKEDVYPEIAVDIIGLFVDGKFRLAGFKTVGITDKAYIANKELVDKLLQSIEINDYKGQKQLDQIARLGNFEESYLSLKPNTLFDRHLMAIGTTNSGKSTSALSILDKLVLNKNKILLIDPTGEYQDSFSGTEIVKLTLGQNATLPVGQLLTSQWERIFETNDNTQGATLNKAIQSLRYQMKSGDSGILIKDGKRITDITNKLACLLPSDTEFDLLELPAQIQAEAVQLDKNGTVYTNNPFMTNTNNWLYEKVQHVLLNTSISNFFTSDSEKNLLAKIDAFLSDGGSSLYIDSSTIGTTDGIGAMIIDLISNYIINKKREEIQPFVMYIDEIHRYMKNTSSFNSGLVSIAREGRKKGIFLFLTTQNPKDVPDVLLGQIGSMIIHRLTQVDEIRAIQNQVSENTIHQIRKLNQGEAILASINLIQDVHVRFDKSSRSHDNNTPLLGGKDGES